MFLLIKNQFMLNRDYEMEIKNTNPKLRMCNV